MSAHAHESAVSDDVTLTDNNDHKEALRADPWADEAIAAIVGRWPLPPFLQAGVGLLPSVDHAQPQWAKLAAVTRVFAEWQTNNGLIGWQNKNATVSPEIAATLEKYVKAAAQLPDWADRDKILRAEKVFMDYGALSVMLLFCSSLPECYVIPDLSAVLHMTGQLEERTDYRIRSTGAMIFPVMMRGGITDSEGAGLAQVFKVRLIHATIRNLILRTSPEQAVAALGTDAAAIPPLANAATDSMLQTIFANGWDVATMGLPCDQEELAYTLLTFGFVFLRSMRKLGIGLSRAEEEAYLHAWNVAGHFLGIERSWMRETFDEAETLFAQIRKNGRADQQTLAFDPRPALGQALMNAMSGAIPMRLFKPFPVLLTRHLCDSQTAKDIGIKGSVPVLSQLTFWAIVFFAKAIDAVVRLFVANFSLSRMFARVLGYHLLSRLLMDQTRPLKLPQSVLNEIAGTVADWGDDRQAPKWVNTLEDKMTTMARW